MGSIDNNYALLYFISILIKTENYFFFSIESKCIKMNQRDTYVHSSVSKQNLKYNTQPLKCTIMYKPPGRQINDHTTYH